MTKILLTWLLLMSASLAFAQSTMYVKKYDGSTTTFPLSGVEKLTFSSGNMEVARYNTSTVPFALDEISRVTFSGQATGVQVLKDDEIENFFVFPNPGNADVKLKYQAKESGSVFIEIIDTKGGLVQQQNQFTMKGKNYLSMNVSKLPNGLYLFRIRNDFDFETVYFLKN